MMDRSEIVGKKILAVLQSPWRPFEGIELSGVAGPTWYSCRLFVRLEGTALIEVANDTFAVPEGVLEGLVDAETTPDAAGTCQGETIADLLTDEYRHVYVLLSSGRLLYDSIDQPGGNLPILELPSAGYLKELVPWKGSRTTGL